MSSVTTKKKGRSKFGKTKLGNGKVGEPNYGKFWDEYLYLTFHTEHPGVYSNAFIVGFNITIYSIVVLPS